MIIKEFNSLEELESFSRSKEYCAVDCYGEFCSACVMLQPVFDAAAGDMAGVAFGRINVSKCMEAAEKFGINALPTILFFRDGELVHRVIGSMEREDLLKELSVLLYQ